MPKAENSVTQIKSMSSSSLSSRSSGSSRSGGRRRKKYYEEIREEIKDINDAVIIAGRHGGTKISKFIVKEHLRHIQDRDRRKKIAGKLEGIWEIVGDKIDFPTRLLDPLTQKDVDSLYNTTMQFIGDYAVSFMDSDKTIAVQNNPDTLLKLRKVRKDRDLRNPRYDLLVPEDAQKLIQVYFKNLDITRICFALDIVDSTDYTQMSGFLVFFRNLEKDRLIVELFFLDPERLEKHPAVRNIDDQLEAMLAKIVKKKYQVEVGIFWSEQSEKEFIQYLPFCENIRPFTFNLIWNTYLFLDRLREPQYTTKDLETVVTDFDSLDVDIRKGAYLECFFLLSRLMFFLTYTK